MWNMHFLFCILCIATQQCLNTLKTTAELIKDYIKIWYWQISHWQSHSLGPSINLYSDHLKNLKQTNRSAFLFIHKKPNIDKKNNIIKPGEYLETDHLWHIIKLLLVHSNLGKKRKHSAALPHSDNRVMLILVLLCCHGELCFHLPHLAIH